MLPHMLFADDVPDVGSTRDLAIATEPARAARHRDVLHHATTGDRHRDVAGRARRSPPDDRAAFLGELFPKLVAVHEWLYRERDPDRCGLVTLIHPWECGLDTTPPWMQALARMPVPWWARAATRFHLAHVVRFLRRDTKYIPSVQRPTDDEGLRMLVLAQLAKRHGFELRRMPRDRSVLIQDLAFNAILAAANRSLTAIAAELDTALPPELPDHFARRRPRSKSCGTTTPASTTRATRSLARSCALRPSPRSSRCSPACPRPNAPTGCSRASARPVGSGRASRCRRSPPTRPSSATRRTGRARPG